MNRQAERVERRLEQIFEQYGYAFTRFAFAFVFVYFGAQKPLVPGASPVREPVSAFVTAMGVGTLLPVPVLWALFFIGFYEMLMGFLFLFNRVRLATPLFIAHQLTTLLALVVVPYVAFRPPYATVGGVAVPYALDWFSAFVLKNVLFIAAFVYFFREYRRRKALAAGETDVAAEPAVPADD